jgi:hypothetical protein
LPAENGTYLASILADELNLPSPREVAAQVMLTNVQREANKLWSIPPIDMSKSQLAEQRREKDRKRKRLARRRARMQSRSSYLASVASDKPWIKEGVSRRTWFRHRAKRKGNGHA